MTVGVACADPHAGTLEQRADTPENPARRHVGKRAAAQARDSAVTVVAATRSSTK